MNHTESDAEWNILDEVKHPFLDENKHTSSIPFFHQLHCVWIFRQILLRRPVPRKIHHAQHCANLLRQWALCAADLTLEPGDFTQRDFEIERLGAVHVCQDWAQIQEEVDENWQDWLAYYYDNHVYRYEVHWPFRLTDGG